MSIGGSDTPVLSSSADCDAAAASSCIASASTALAVLCRKEP
jgi:hypothetical protein